MNSEFEFVSHYADEADLRNSLNELTQTEWGISVLNQGDVDYVPFSMVKDGKVVANICVGTFDLVIDGSLRKANLIQTVLTHPDFRRKGLIRDLFRHVKPYIESCSGLTFFPAARDKKGFYRQFGYIPNEFSEFFLVDKPNGLTPNSGLEKIDYHNPEQRSELEKAVELRDSVSDVLGYRNTNWLFYWYCSNFHHNHIYYIEALQAYVLYRIEDRVLVLLDIVAREIPSFDTLVSYLPLEKFNRVKIMFCPDKLNVDCEAVLNEVDYFYTCNDFPLPSVDFCMPETLRG